MAIDKANCIKISNLQREPMRDLAARSCTYLQHMRNWSHLERARRLPSCRLWRQTPRRHSQAKIMKAILQHIQLHQNSFTAYSANANVDTYQTNSYLIFCLLLPYWMSWNDLSLLTLVFCWSTSHDPKFCWPPGVRILKAVLARCIAG